MRVVKEYFGFFLFLHLLFKSSFLLIFRKLSRNTISFVLHFLSGFYELQPPPVDPITIPLVIGHVVVVDDVDVDVFGKVVGI